MLLLNCQDFTAVGTAILFPFNCVTLEGRQKSQRVKLHCLHGRVLLELKDKTDDVLHFSHV